MTAPSNWPVIWVLTFLVAFHALVILALGFAHWCQMLTGMGAAFGLLGFRHAE